MKIQCQNCTKTYLVSPDQIGKSGRKVKCANCYHTWHQYLQESSNNLCIANIQEKEAGNRSFLRSLAFTTATLIATTTLCFIMADSIFPNEMKKVYKTINTYKDSISYKLGYKKEKQDNPHVRKLAANKFHQDYLFLSKNSAN